MATDNTSKYVTKEADSITLKNSFQNASDAIVKAANTISSGSGDGYFTQNEIDELYGIEGIYNRDKQNFFGSFSRFGIVDPFTSLTGCREYLFFTKPDLNLFSTKGFGGGDGTALDREDTTTQGKADNLPLTGLFTASDAVYNAASSSSLNPDLEKYPFFIEMKDRYSNVAEQLQASVLSPSNPSPFMCCLSNAVVDTLDLPDINTKEMDTASTVYGTHITYQMDDFSSDEAHSFSLEFEDTRYAEIYMLFKCWHEYTRRKTFGEIEPINSKYREDKILHDQIAIYKFIVADDNETIIHYSKLYGCRPQGVPRSVFSDLNLSNGFRFSVNWKAEFVEDMDPMILVDFNQLVKSYNENKANLPLFNIDKGHTEPSWASSAYIVGQKKQNYKNLRSAAASSYKLKWTK